MAKFLYCLITDRSNYRQCLHEIARCAEETGVDYFQLREKQAGHRELMELACHIRPLLNRTKFIVNGHLDVALASGADGVHLQKENIPLNAVRRRFPSLLIGYSAHTIQELREAESDGADYAFISPIFAPRSKKTDLPVLGTAGLKDALCDIRIPVFGLGGVSISNVAELKDCGCAGAAGISLFANNGSFDPSAMVV